MPDNFFMFLPMWLIMIYRIFPKQPLADTYDLLTTGMEIKCNK